VRDYAALNAHAQDVLNRLEEYFIRKSESNSWPGTLLKDSTATVLYYRSEERILDVLFTAKSLYHWQHPDYPEDLSFYTKEGTNWFCSISHEHDAFFLPGYFTKDEIKTSVPGLRLLIRLPSSGT
jgi:hypothetical protein